MIVTDSPAACVYEIDSDYRIVSVDPSWTLFAVENSAPELVPPAPYGRAVWSYISDLATAHMFKQLFDKVMHRGVTLTVPIRCDAPDKRRFLQLEISRRPPSGVRIASTEVRVEPRDAVLLLDRALPRIGPQIRMCSWCKRVEANDRWLEVEEAVTVLRLFERAALPDVSHGMCPDCKHAIDLLLDDR